MGDLGTLTIDAAIFDKVTKCKKCGEGPLTLSTLLKHLAKPGNGDCALAYWGPPKA